MYKKGCNHKSNTSSMDNKVCFLLSKTFVARYLRTGISNKLFPSVPSSFNRTLRRNTDNKSSMNRRIYFFLCLQALNEYLRRNMDKSSRYLRVFSLYFWAFQWISKGVSTITSLWKSGLFLKLVMNIQEGISTISLLWISGSISFHSLKLSFKNGYKQFAHDGSQGLFPSISPQFLIDI